jgi:hypothetical protein
MKNHLLMLFAALLVLTGCGRSTTPDEPRASSSNLPPATSTAPPAEVLVSGAPVIRYTHLPSQRFSILYPADWQILEQPDGVLFVDPSSQAGYSIFFSETEQDLTDFALDFVESNFGQNPNFEIVEQTPTAIRFKTDDTNLGPSINELTFSAADGLVYLSLMSIIEAKWEVSAPAMRDLMTSLKFLVGPTPTPRNPNRPPQWAAYVHPTRFGFLYPDTWQLTEDETSVQVTQSDRGYQFSVQVLDLIEPDPDSTADSLETYAQAQLEHLNDQYETFEALPLTDYQAGGATGYTVDYLYQDEAEMPMAESFIITRFEDQIFQITISAPAVVYEEALVWFNLMLDSFQILPADD